MPSRFSKQQLTDKALAALEEACADAVTAPTRPTQALRFALAWLGNDAADRSPFDAFWNAVTGAGDAGINPMLVDVLRKSTAEQALRAIYEEHGRERPSTTP